MMARTILILLVSFALAGCGEKSAPVATLEQTPLSTTEWKAMPIEHKYEIETLERLKLGDPKLQNSQAWDRFLQTVVVPSRKKDFSNKR